MNLGSLFSGIGGFELAASRAGIEPAWASEIDKACLLVTSRHFPGMAQHGDICKMDGSRVDPVSLVTMGSPCQDISLAGSRAGLSGERSALFFEGTRIVRELRKQHGKPRYVIWENVPGIFSSNDGRDFKAVLEAFADAEIPMPRSIRWAKSGVVRGTDRSIAWRTLDAKYFGVPQRRRRVFVIVDLDGQRAGEILFEPQSLHGNTAKGGAGGVDVARPIVSSPHRKDCADRETYVTVARCDTAGESRRYDGESCTLIPTLRTNWRNNSNPATEASILVLGFSGNNSATSGSASCTEEMAPTLQVEKKSCVCTRTVMSVDARNGREGVINKTLQVGVRGSAPNNGQIIREQMSVRRLTPTECERLQGFPDEWTFGSDSARYRMIGNSVAVPVVEWIMRRLVAVNDQVGPGTPNVGMAQSCLSSFIWRGHK